MVRFTAGSYAILASPAYLLMIKIMTNLETTTAEPDTIYPLRILIRLRTTFFST